MTKNRSGLHIFLGASLLVVLAVYLIPRWSELGVTAQKASTGIAPAQNTEPNQGQDQEMFIPFVQSEDAANAAQEGNSVEQVTEEILTRTPESDAATPIAEVTAEPVEPDLTPQIYSYPEETRGKVINLGGVDIHLPEDAYVESVMIAVEPVPGREPVTPPVVVLQRGASVIGVENATGRMFPGDPIDVVLQDFDFLVQALGADKVVIIPRLPEETVEPVETEEPNDASQ